MPQLLEYSRTRTTSVEQTTSDTILAVCRLQDTLMDAEVEIVATLPDLEITAVKGCVFRDGRGRIPDDLEALDKALGIRIGPGMSRIIKGLVGESFPCRQLVFMLEECCHGIILYFTKGELAKVPGTEKEARGHFSRLVRENNRLYNRCAAFAPGSSLVDGIKPPAGDTSS